MTGSDSADDSSDNLKLVHGHPTWKSHDWKTTVSRWKLSLALAATTRACVEIVNGSTSTLPTC